MSSDGGRAVLCSAVGRYRRTLGYARFQLGAASVQVTGFRSTITRSRALPSLKHMLLLYFEVCIAAFFTACAPVVVPTEQVGLHGIVINFTDDRGSSYSATFLPEVAAEQGARQPRAYAS